MLIPLRDNTRAETAPLLTVLLIGLNVVIYIFCVLDGALETMIQRFGWMPGSVLQNLEILFSSIFLHANVLHLVSNMWFLWLYGDNVEDRFGRLNYLILYLLSGVTGNVIHTIFTGFDSNAPVIGASGAVAGVMGSYLICFPKAKIKTLFILVFYPLFFRLPAMLLLGVWMVGEFWMAYLAPPGDHVAHWAHIGGFVVGILWGWQRRHPLARPRGWWW